jgi:hypothetical protein
MKYDAPVGAESGIHPCSVYEVGDPLTSDDTLARKLFSVNATARLEKELALSTAHHDGSELAISGTAERDDVGASRDGFVDLLFCPAFGTYVRRG